MIVSKYIEGVIMKDIQSCLRDISTIVKDKNCESFLVGGAIRDIFLNKKIKDFDIVINKRVEEIARFFADENEASVFSLDEEREIYRVILEDCVFDFAAIIGENINQDLQRRDFTINA